MSVGTGTSSGTLLLISYDRVHRSLSSDRLHLWRPWLPGRTTDRRDPSVENPLGAAVSLTGREPILGEAIEAWGSGLLEANERVPGTALLHPSRTEPAELPVALPPKGTRRSTV